MDKRSKGQVVETNPLPYKQQVKNLILKYLKEQRIKQGGKISTIRLLANELGVGKSTVQVALKDLAMQGLVYSRVGKGTFTMKRIKEIRLPTKTIGVSIANLNNPIFAEFVQEVERTASGYGYDVSIFTDSSRRDVNRNLIRQIKEKRIDGLVAILPNKQLITEAIQSNTPLVSLTSSNNSVLNSKIDTVTCSHEKALYLLTSHLLSLGHERITISIYKRAEHVKLKGFKKALASCRLIFTEDMVIEDPKEPDPSYPDWYRKTGRGILKRVLRSRDLPTALIVSNDARAIGILGEAENEGIRVPEDMAVVSFDNISLSSSLKPPLTTVDLKYRERAKKAFQLFLERVEGKRKKAGKHIEVEPELIIRESCGAKLRTG